MRDVLGNLSIAGLARRLRSSAPPARPRILDIADLPPAAPRDAAPAGPLLTTRLGAALRASEAPRRPEEATMAALHRALHRLEAR